MRHELRHKARSLRRRSLLGEWAEQSAGDVQPFQQQAVIAGTAEPFRYLGRAQNPQGMRIEAHDDGCSLMLGRVLLCRADYFLVAKVQTVKDTNRQGHGAGD